MGWDEHRKRRAALMAVVAHAEQHPSAGLPYEELKQVRAVFVDRSDLVLALQYMWSQALWSRIELLGSQITRPSDAATLARAAWDQCAAANRTLRRLLDEQLRDCGRCIDAVRSREQDLMAAGAAAANAQGHRWIPPHVA